MNDCNHGDYIIYADESGDYSMDDVNKLYPAFVLAFCVFSKKVYLEEVIKNVKSFKFKFWGHDLTVLHSSKLRKRVEDFQFLHNQVVRANFINELNNIIDGSPFEIISMAIDKRHLQEETLQPCNPYELSIIIESRGKKEDDELQVAFQRIVEMNDDLQMMCPLKLCFADKKTNSIGLQIADLVAYPIGRFLINPEQENPAFKIIDKKFRMYPDYYGNGFKVLSHVKTSEKRKNPEFSEV